MIEPQVFTLDEVRRMIASGEIVDMKTVAGLALLPLSRPAHARAASSTVAA